jgi:hypothetical protein
MAQVSTQPLKEMSTRNISWGYKRPVLRADTLTIFMCRLLENLGTSTSWNLQGLPSLVQGLSWLLYIMKYACTLRRSDLMKGKAA